MSYLEPRHDGIPSGVNLPTFLSNGTGTWPGQHAGFLGPRHDPWQVTHDPNAPDFRMDGLRLDPTIEVDRLGDRRTLLAHIDGQRENLAGTAEGRRLSDQQQQAFSILTSGKMAQAFDLEREPVAVRDRYGRHTFGQSLLLARRLVQAGVPVVQVNMGSLLNWDTHSDNFGRLEEPTLAAYGPGRGRFARRPGGNRAARRHAGAGDWRVRPLAAHGRQNLRQPHLAGRPRSLAVVLLRPVCRRRRARRPADRQVGFDRRLSDHHALFAQRCGATVYHILGVDPAAEVRDRLGRPTQLNRGQVMRALFEGGAE